DRAERALLGALLQDPDQVNSARFVTALDFASPQHQAIFNAIIGATADNRAGRHQPYGLILAVANSEPGLDHGQLQSLVHACPEPTNAPTYARMVTEASMYRELATHAERITAEASTRSHLYEMWQQSATASPSAAAVPAHLRRLAAAMRAHTLDPASQASTAASGAQRSTQTPPRPIDIQARQEQEVLAGLIQDFRHNGRVLTWLPPEAFTPGLRREIYQAIRSLARDQEPIEELTVEWQLARNKAFEHAINPNATTDQPTTVPPHGSVAEIAALDVAVGTATLTGRRLLDRHAAKQLQAGLAANQSSGPPSTSHTGGIVHGLPSPTRGSPPRATEPRPQYPPPGLDRCPGRSGPEPHL
ncbi:MAG TPA: DnaB-like helicase N-terminal domain-containing protein, partial [Acidobacteriaceae bacterium]|nr:DnaB-like helicase N-terminal domain-containing protein [Acidobacteriaceae bacterium]